MIVWRVTRADPTIASFRYRAALPALHLAALGYESRFSNRHEPLPTRNIDAVIFVKAFSQDDLKAAEQAHRHRIPIFLDVCDNIFVAGYSSFGARPETFRKMASLASAVVTTGSALAGVMRKETSDRRTVVIVPDCVETEADQEQIRRIVNEWQLYGPARRTYYRARARVREEGLLLCLGRTLLRTSQGRRPFRFATEPVRAMFRASRLTVKHGPSVARIVVLRVREEGPGWIFRGLARRTRVLIDRLSEGAAPRPVVSESVMISVPPSRYDSGRTGDGERIVESRFSEAPANPDRESGSTMRTLIWFGNQGAPYGQFGLRELASLSRALSAVAKRHRIQLIVVSNCEARFNELIRPFPLPTFYVGWRPGVVEELFKQSEIALLPNSLDAFSVCKSANRAVLALHHGIRVVATRTPALEPFDGCMIFNDWIGGIETYLNDKQLCQQHIAAAQAIIAREFSGERVARMWNEILHQAPVLH